MLFLINYDGFIFLICLNIGFVNGKGIDKNYFLFLFLKNIWKNEKRFCYGWYIIIIIVFFKNCIKKGSVLFLLGKVFVFFRIMKIDVN